MSRVLTRRLTKARELLDLFFRKTETTCYFCGKRFEKKDLGLLAITIHHRNHNREINEPWNLEFAHRKCHKAYHLRERKNNQLLFQTIKGES